MMASPTWLAAVDEDPSLATQPVGTGPFTVAEYLPGDRMTVVKNPDYWRQDEAGNQLPYLDEIEFRVIVDSQTRQAALESGEVDLIATADPTVVGPLSENDSFVTLLQNVLTETAYVMLHLTKPQFQSKERPVRAGPGDRQAGPHRRRLRRVPASRRTARSRPARTATSRTPGSPSTTRTRPGRRSRRGRRRTAR